MGNNVVFSDSWILPNFLFSRKEMIPFKNLSQAKIIELLQSGKIIEYSGAINQSIIVGIHQYIEQNNTFMSTLWFDTENLPQFDSYKVSSALKDLYFTIVRCIKGCDALFLAMGPEMMFKFSTNYVNMINDSHGVLMWWFKDGLITTSSALDFEKTPKTP